MRLEWIVFGISSLFNKIARFHNNLNVLLLQCLGRVYILDVLDLCWEVLLELLLDCLYKGNSQMFLRWKQ